ncbi:hypothetical protein PIIN_03215 [Serendipita indica DSM 11827]|uniref:Uncharacterized protein n=1 Tax=Serendipita indica (strain DSM 11827) TaxID=1109443 RepID=G4TDC2_SERID|nr:hypothetical protein PIIN_03215 [Serendipita indica DSM 11827]
MVSRSALVVSKFDLRHLKLGMIHLPVEIWRYILLYAIDAPKILHIDPIPKGNLIEEAPYWASERTRNALRRVCSSWNRFLAIHSHRYIRISDFFHHMVPAASLPNATRIRIDECYCSKCSPFTSDRFELASIFENCVKSAHTLTGPIPWRVRIIDVEKHGYLDILALEPSRISNLRALLYWRGGNLPDIIFSASPPLSILRMRESDLAKMKQLDLSKISTLDIFGIQRTNLGVVHFPSLTHVSLDMSYVSRTHRNRVEQVLEWLQVYGRRLETFYWIDHVSEITDSEVDKVWSLCPQLQRIHLPLKATWPPPPSAHTLQQLRVYLFERLLSDEDYRSPAPCPACNYTHVDVVQFSHHLPQIAASGVGRIEIMTLVWHKWFDNTNAHIFCFWTQAKSYAIEVVDVSGMTFEQALVAYLEECKRRSVCKRV